MLNQKEIEEYWELFWQWVQAEGLWRMIEHIIVAIVILQLIRSLVGLQINPRGKKGIIGAFTKLVVRISRKFSFVNKKI